MIGFDRATLFGSHIEGFWLPQRIFFIAATWGGEKNRQISSSSSSETKKTVNFRTRHYRSRKKRMKVVNDIIGTEKNGRILQTASLELRKRVIKPELHRV
jgi:hypothetical protein